MTLFDAAQETLAALRRLASHDETSETQWMIVQDAFINLYKASKEETSNK